MENGNIIRNVVWHIDRVRGSDPLLQSKCAYMTVQKRRMGGSDDCNRFTCPQSQARWELPLCQMKLRPTGLGYVLAISNFLNSSNSTRNHNSGQRHTDSKSSNMPAPLYARYVPPKAARPAPKQTPVPLPPNMSPPQTVVPLPESPAEKPKKRKRTIEQPYPVVEPTEEAKVETKEPTIKQSKSKKEKANKRKREIEQTEPAEESNDTVSKKHKAVLSKFERSSKLAETIRSEGGATSEKPIEDEAPKQELHG